MNSSFLRIRAFAAAVVASVTLIAGSGIATVNAAPLPVEPSARVEQASVTGVIVIDLTKLRGGPGNGFWELATLRRNNSVTVLGKSADGAFLNVKAKGRTGWVLTSAVTAGVGDGVPVVATDPIGTVTVGNAAVRFSPGISAQRKAIISNGEQFFIIGRQPDGTWLNIRSRFGTGWIATVNTDLAGNGAAVAAPATANPRIIVNAAFLNVRSGPGSQYTTIATLSGGDEAPIIGRTDDGVWLLVTTGAGNGWVRRFFVIVRDYNDNAPVITDFSGAVLEMSGRVLGIGAINLRTAPNLGSDSIATLYAGTNVTILGQSADGDWWYVTTESGKGWVTKRYVTATAASRNAPVVN